MGLLSKITEGETKPSPSRSSKSEGLLARMEKLQQASKLYFFDFIKQNNIPKCAVFEQSGNNYIIIKSFGLDYESLKNSKSTVDFWNGAIPQSNMWISSFSLDKSINTLLQLFSQDIKDTIKEINAFKANNSILLILKEKDQEMELESISSDFLNLDKSLKTVSISDKTISDYNKQKVCLDLRDSISSLLETLSPEETLIDSIETNLENALIYKIKEIFPYYSDIIVSDKTVSFYIYSKECVNEVLLKRHIEKAFTDWKITQAQITLN